MRPFIPSLNLCATGLSERGSPSASFLRPCRTDDGPRMAAGNGAANLLTGADTLHEYPSPKLPFRLVNNYGPTESTVVATSGTVDSANRPGVLPSIGKPIDNTQIYILDERLRPAAPGTLGEIYIGGAGLARGYRNRPELTAEKFIANPFSTDPESRLYRTGDFGSFSQMAKSLLRDAPTISSRFAAIAWKSTKSSLCSTGIPRCSPALLLPGRISRATNTLVAYVVARQSQEESNELNSRTLREFLRTFLPEYMLPAIFVRLERLPLSAHGKVDRQALPVPDAANTLRDEACTSPRSALESEVGAIVTSLLNSRDLGVHDNFFLLGGSSFLGIQVIARVREKFAVEVPLRALFEAPTISELSAQIAQLRAAKNGDDCANRAHGIWNQTDEKPQKKSWPATKFSPGGRYGLQPQPLPSSRTRSARQSLSALPAPADGRSGPLGSVHSRMGGHALWGRDQRLA